MYCIISHCIAKKAKYHLKNRPVRAGYHGIFIVTNWKVNRKASEKKLQ